MEYSKKKWIYIGIVIALIVILIIVTVFMLLSSKNKEITYETLTASDGSFSVSIPNNISYRINNQEDNEFVIDLYSNEDKMFFYATKISKSREIDLTQIVTDDKENYLKDKQNIREDSGILSFNIQNYKSYEYHFIYNDSSCGIDFYSNVLWIETDKNLYVLNFEIANENLEKYQDIFLNIKNSFMEL